MAEPTILFNSSTGSDTQASGAGPGTALFGTTDASTDGAGTTVTLTAGTDLTNVATDGSHAIFLNDTTAGARNFGKITGKAGSGGATPTVTVANAFGLTLTNKSWAIGGKRLTLSGTTSKKLWMNNSSNGDALAGWILELNSAFSDAFTERLNLVRAVTTAAITIRATSGYATMPILSWNTNDICMLFTGTGWIVEDMDLRNTNGTKASTFGAYINTTACTIRRCKIAHATDYFRLPIYSAAGSCVIESNEVSSTASGASGISCVNTSFTRILGNHVYTCGSHGIDIGSSSSHAQVSGNLVRGCSGDGMNLLPAFLICVANTVYGNTGDGIEFNAVRSGMLVLLNNNVTNNGGYGLNLHASETALTYFALPTTHAGNNWWTNTSGQCDVSGIIPSSDQNLDPQYTNAGSLDFTIGTNLKALGFPSTNLPGLSVRSYTDIGALQRQEAGGSGGGANPIGLGSPVIKAA